MNHYQQEEIEIKNAILNYYYTLYGNNFVGFEILAESTVHNLFKTRTRHETKQEIYSNAVSIIDHKLGGFKHVGRLNK